MKKIIVVLSIFCLDRISKIYLINLQSSGTEVDFYILPFMNFYLVWNTGIGFGLVSLESNILYHILTGIIAMVNIMLIVGAREAESGQVSVRRRFLGDQGQMNLEDLIEELVNDIKQRRRIEPSQT